MKIITLFSEYLHNNDKILLEYFKILRIIYVYETFSARCVIKLLFISQIKTEKLFTLWFSLGI